MQNAAMWLASIFGPFLVILGLWMLLYCDQYTKVLNGIKGSAGLFYMNSVFNLLIGFTVLSQYDLWGWNLYTGGRHHDDGRGWHDLHRRRRDNVHQRRRDPRRHLCDTRRDPHRLRDRLRLSAGRGVFGGWKLLGGRAAALLL